MVLLLENLLGASNSGLDLELVVLDDPDSARVWSCGIYSKVQ